MGRGTARIRAAYGHDDAEKRGGGGWAGCGWGPETVWCHGVRVAGGTGVGAVRQRCRCDVVTMGR